MRNMRNMREHPHQCSRCIAEGRREHREHTPIGVFPCSHPDAPTATRGVIGTLAQGGGSHRGTDHETTATVHATHQGLSRRKEQVCGSVDCARAAGEGRTMSAACYRTRSCVGWRRSWRDARGSLLAAFRMRGAKAREWPSARAKFCLAPRTIVSGNQQLGCVESTSEVRGDAHRSSSRMVLVWTAAKILQHRVGVIDRHAGNPRMHDATQFERIKISFAKPLLMGQGGVLLVPHERLKTSLGIWQASHVDRVEDRR